MDRRERGGQFVRQWQILVLLRRRAYTLSMLAAKLGVCQRTVRRDIYLLERVPFPIYRVKGQEIGDPTYWKIGPIPAWSRSEESPSRELRS
jgi:hypothetical protein